MKAIALLPLLLTLFCEVNAKNNWTQPCFNGSCSYDIPSNDTSIGGTFTISGSSTSISDITPAAGWEILNCTTSTNSQTIQLVCTDETKGCSHLFQKGAQHTVVRLPENCGAGPFVRVAKHWTPANQSLPAHVASKFRRSDGSTPQVQLLQIDANFNESASSGQTVEFSLVASSASGNTSLAPATSPSHRRMRNLHRRIDGSSKRFSISLPSIPNPTSFGDSTSKSLDINFSKSVELFNSALSCAGDENENEEITLKVDVDADVALTATFSFDVSGTVIPPDVSKFTATTTLDGTFDATLSVDADLIGTLDTGKIDIFSDGLPGLSIPDILTIGPQFDLFAEASATINLDADVSVGVHYELNGLSFTVGSSSSSSPGFAPLDSPVQFSLDPSITAKATLEAHLIPTLSLGLSAFDNTVNVFVDLDAGLEVDLNATVSGDLSVSTSGSASASESAKACVDISSPISINVGATGDLFGIIDESTSIPIYEKTFDIYQKCFTQAEQNSAPPASPPSAPAGFFCLNMGSIQAVIFPQTIPSSLKGLSTFPVANLQAEPCSFTTPVPALTGVCLNTGDIYAEVIGDPTGVQIVDSVMELQSLGILAVGCPVSTAFTTPTEALPRPTSSSPPPVCFDVNGVMAMIPNNFLPQSALVWQLFLAEPCPAGNTLPTPSNPGMCVLAEGTMLPIISNNMTAAAAAVNAIGFTSETLSVVTCPSDVFSSTAGTTTSTTSSHTTSTALSTTHISSIGTSLPPTNTPSTVSPVPPTSSTSPLEIITSTTAPTSSIVKPSSPVTIDPSTISPAPSSSRAPVSSSSLVSSHSTNVTATVSTSHISSASSSAPTSGAPLSPESVSKSTLSLSSISPTPSSSQPSSSSVVISRASSSSKAPISSSSPTSVQSTNVTSTVSTSHVASTSSPSSSAASSSESVVKSTFPSSSILPTPSSNQFASSSAHPNVSSTASVAQQSVNASATSTISASLSSQSLVGTSSSPFRIVDPTTSSLPPAITTSTDSTSISTSQGEATSTIPSTSLSAISTGLSSSESSSSSPFSTSSTSVANNTSIYGVPPSNPTEQSSVSGGFTTHPTIETSYTQSSSQVSPTSVAYSPSETSTSYPNATAGTGNTTVAWSTSTNSPVPTSFTTISGPIYITTNTSSTASPSSILTTSSPSVTSTTLTSANTSQSTHTIVSPSSQKASPTPSRPSSPHPPPPSPPKTPPRPAHNHNNAPGIHHRPGQVHRPSQHQRPSQFQNPGPYRGTSQSERPKQNQGPKQPSNAGPYQAPGQYQGPPANQRPDPYQSFGGAGGNMYQSTRPNQSQPGRGYPSEESNAYSQFGPSGGFGGFGVGGSQRVGYGGVQSWTESNRYYSYRTRRQPSTPEKRDLFSRGFSCPAPSSSESTPVDESSDVAAASEVVE
ncbi:hypothetical protein SCHPADRAFT_151790 [Schizopora paradoxa]|uniref:Uncharacterized protein n=1 Tax=Schizopora paradoxa TaxID=27342 RepID=A0A0H2S1R1_9AGAM|nr:hypothetical protein SCHPADRAFT_151790 [Schizopora paradoxa]